MRPADPSDATGAMRVAGATAVATLVLAAFVHDDLALLDAVVWSVAFAAPAALLARFGHLGSGRWRVPTPGAWIFFMWHLGIVPSTLGVDPGAQRAFLFGDTAVLVGRLVYLVWATLFVVALGRAGEPAKPVRAAPRLWLMPLLALLALWLVGALVAADANVLATHSGSLQRRPTAGGGAIVLIFMFHTISRLLPSLAARLLATPSRDARSLAWPVLGAAGAMLFLIGSRSGMLIAMLLALSALSAKGIVLSRRWIISAGLAALLVLGPLTMAYRYVLHEAQKDKVQEVDLVDLGGNAITRFTTNAEFRDKALGGSAENVRSRLGFAGLQFGVVEVALERGGNFSPSFLFGLINIVPTAIWPEKSKVAAPLELEGQLHRLRRFPYHDLGPTPIVEFVFQLGVFVGALGGALYGLIARLLTRTLSAASARLEWWLPWAGAFMAMLLFETTVANQLVALREPLLLAGGVWLLGGAQTSSAAPAWTARPGTLQPAASAGTQHGPRRLP